MEKSWVYLLYEIPIIQSEYLLYAVFTDLHKLIDYVNTHNPPRFSKPYFRIAKRTLNPSHETILNDDNDYDIEDLDEELVKYNA